MRILMLTAVLILSGCAGQVTLPPTLANNATKAEITAEAAYQAATRSARVAAGAGLIDRERFHALDNQAYAALAALRHAHDVSDAANAADAQAHLQATIAAIVALTHHTTITGEM